MEEMSNIFGVSVRTICRDIEYLSGEMMIPIYCQSGKYNGGVYIESNYRWDRMYMSIEQTRLLIKVKNLTSKELSEQENIMFEEIINFYTFPSKK